MNWVTSFATHALELSKDDFIQAIAIWFSLTGFIIYRIKQFIQAKKDLHSKG